MPNWVALSRSRHADSDFLPRQGYDFARQHMLSPILLAELGRLLPHYALGFVWRQDRYLPVALLGLGGQNCYLHEDGRWLADYVPADLRGYPFALADGADGKKVLCIDEERLIAKESGGQPLFDDQGEVSDSVKGSLHFLEQCEKSRQSTVLASKMLHDSGLLTAWELQISRGEEQSPLSVQDLFRIDEKALNALSADTLGELRASGALALAYAQLFSMHQLEQLRQRILFHQKANDQRHTGPSFLNDQDDELMFDFGD